MEALRTRLMAFRRKYRVGVSEMALLLGMTAREYRSLERGITHEFPASVLPLVLTGIERRLSGRINSTASRARKNAERSATRATCRKSKPTARPRDPADI